jgi:hypothetical protein
MPLAGGKLEQKAKILNVRRWLEYLAAILLGNAIYFLSFLPHLPVSVQHQAFRVDWGLGLDFLICVVVYGLLRLGSRL